MNTSSSARKPSECEKQTYAIGLLELNGNAKGPGYDGHCEVVPTTSTDLNCSKALPTAQKDNSNTNTVAQKTVQVNRLHKGKVGISADTLEKLSKPDTDAAATSSNNELGIQNILPGSKLSLGSSTDSKLELWRSAGIALKQTLTQIVNQRANHSNRGASKPVALPSSTHVPEGDMSSVPDHCEPASVEEHCVCSKRTEQSKCVQSASILSQRGKSSEGIGKNQSQPMKCLCVCHHNQDGMNEMLDDYNFSDLRDKLPSAADSNVAVGLEAERRVVPSDVKPASLLANMSVTQQRVQFLTRRIPAGCHFAPPGGRRRRTSQRSQASPARQGGESESSDVDAAGDGRVTRRPARHRADSYAHHRADLSPEALVSPGSDTDEVTPAPAVWTAAVTSLTPPRLTQTDSVANMADIESCSDGCDGTTRSSGSDDRKSDVTIEPVATVPQETGTIRQDAGTLPQDAATTRASFSVSYDVDSDDLAELCDLDLGLAVSDPEQNEVEISLADLADLPELFDESAISEDGQQTADGDADDEFECECSMCCLGDLSWTEGQEGSGGRHEGNNIHYYSEVTDGYNVPFNFNEAEVSPLDLLTRQNQQRDIVEMMFQNVVHQMLSVYPELLGDQVPPPLSPSVTHALPTVQPVTASTGEDGERTCPICLCDFEEEEEAKLLPCQHVFHSFCIESWLSKSGTCPVCRHVLATGPPV